ncbi:KOW domain-containing RNA-binding protein [Tautonia rosea]|uniref:hypothetical protein n=1 Tax=Tautonia rosea TaxID=2728037 RepID=UPI001475B9BA|nr:hypothetical protein [Tautonia rosea]
MNARIPGWFFLVALMISTEASGQQAQPSLRWLGQVGSDRVSRSNTPGPNGVQDMVFELNGLPTTQAIKSLTLRGYGRDIWGYPGGGGHWSADLQREPGSPRALISVEPSQEETGRKFDIEVELEGGQRYSMSVQGGRANLLARMPEVQLAARWVGTDGTDRVSPGPSVGPDGFEDSKIELARLAPDPEVLELSILAEHGPSWAFGPNPEGKHDALLMRSSEDRTRGTLYLSPTPDLQGKRLRIDLSYNNGTRDRVVLVAGTAPVDRAVTRAPLPRMTTESTPVRWIGQDDRGPLGPGAVTIAVDRSSTRPMRAAVLSDGVTGVWVFEASGAGGSSKMPFVGDRRRRLDVRRGSRPGSMLLSFVPYRDLDGVEMSLRLIDEDGQSSLIRFAGQSCDPTRRFAPPSVKETRVRPGDDLAALVQRGGTIRLSAGIYELDRPLDLLEPIAFIAEPGAELRFRQSPSDEPWPEAIAIRAPGRTTISGLRVRFDGPVRWHRQAAWGAAIIGVPNLGKRPGGPVHVEIRELDLEAPVAGSDWEEAPNCLRFLDTDSGVIEGCTLKGGPIMIFNGPWRVAKNRHRGTQPKTFAGSFLSGREIREIEIVENEVRPEPSSGKLYRFVVLVDRGHQIGVRHNTVVGVGPMDNDERPHPNAPEILLTESYQIRFEGRHAGVSDDGRIVAIPEPQGRHPEVGEVVAVLSGPDAGRWAVIEQILDRNVMLVDRPLPLGDYDVSVTLGFLETVIESNTIDCRGSSEGHPVVLTGNHYGTKLIGNALLGGGNAFRLSAYATNAPFHYAWSHTPQFDLTVESNTVTDSALGGLMAVYHGPQQKTNRGRVYLTGSVLGNTFRWTGAAAPGSARDQVALTVGQVPSFDSGELILKTGSNQALDARGEAVSNPMRIHVGTVNDRRYEPAGK